MANMIVSGAGDTYMNGTYVETGTFGEKPQYYYNTTCHIYWSVAMARWYLEDIQDTGYYYYSTNNVATPDLATWVVNAPYGTAPAPTITAEQSGTTHEGEATISSFSYLRTKKA